LVITNENQNLVKKCGNEEIGNNRLQGNEEIIGNGEMRKYGKSGNRK